MPIYKIGVPGNSIKPAEICSHARQHCSLMIHQYQTTIGSVRSNRPTGQLWKRRPPDIMSRHIQSAFFSRIMRLITTKWSSLVLGKRSCWANCADLLRFLGTGLLKSYLMLSLARVLMYGAWGLREDLSWFPSHYWADLVQRSSNWYMERTRTESSSLTRRWSR